MGYGSVCGGRDACTLGGGRGWGAWAASARLRLMRHTSHARRLPQPGEEHGKHMWGRVCASGFRHAERGGGNQGTARFAHFAHFFQRKGVERGLTFFFCFLWRKKKSPTPPLGVCPSQRRANPAKATLQKTGKILKFSILSFGCRRGTGTPPRPGQGTGRAGGARTCAPVPGHHAPAEHVRVLPQGPAPALGKGHQRVLLPPPPPPR